MISTLHQAIEANSYLKEAGLIFEYALPRERGRRPDALVFLGQTLFVLEFKEDADPRPAYMDQVAAYARDLANYHSACRDLDLHPFLVLKSSSSLQETRNGVVVVSQSSLANALLSFRSKAAGRPTDLEQWMRGDYAPLPGLVAAAKTIFQHEPLRRIRRAQSVGIPQVVADLERVAQQARERGERHLALVTGVPGAGKTLVGLQFVYSDHFSSSSGARSAIFLSGNGVGRRAGSYQEGPFHL